MMIVLVLTRSASPVQTTVSLRAFSAKGANVGRWKYSSTWDQLLKDFLKYLILEPSMNYSRSFSVDNQVLPDKQHSARLPT